MKQKTRGSSRVANMESPVLENLANTESQVTENLANTESRVTKNLANTENQVMQASRGKKLEEQKGAAPSKRLAPRWWPSGITKTQKRRLQKLCQRELAEKKEEKEQDYWFNHL
jgi:3-polyprenyl-4-hydroxybenzoate decarboxylase